MQLVMGLTRPARDIRKLSFRIGPTKLHSYTTIHQRHLHAHGGRCNGKETAALLLTLNAPGSERSTLTRYWTMKTASATLLQSLDGLAGGIETTRI
eukprot:1866117-Pyramimonas_sp.AAC.1